MAEQAEGDLDAELRNLRFDLEEQDDKQEMNIPGGVLPRRGGPTGRTMAPGSKNVVCIHYLVGMCALDKDCPYLHQYDLDRVPICPFGSKCVRDDDCPFKHVMEEDKVECVFYRQGFCMYGPFCRYRHVHRAPEECPEEADFNIHQRDTEDGFADHHGHSSHHHLMGNSRRSSRGSQGVPPSSKGGGREGMMMVVGGGQQQQQRGGDDDSRRPGGALEKNENYKTTLCNHWLSNKGLCPFGEDCVFAHGEAELRKHPLAIAREQQQAQRGGRFHPGAAGGAGVGVGIGGAGGGPPGPPIPAPHEVRFAELGIPWQENWRVRFFVIKSLNYKNLAQSVRRGVWRTHRNNERTLNEAFRTCDKVVLFFSVNESGPWQGSAVMTSPIRPQSQIPPMMHSMQHHQDGWTAEFSLDWLRLVSLPFPHTRPLRNPLNDNLPISRSRDCQELTPEIGRQLLYLIYASPEVSLSLTGDGPMGYGGPMMSGGAHGGPGMSSILSNQSQGGGMDNHLMDAIYVPEHQQQHGGGGGGAAGLHQLPSSSASAGGGRGDFPIFPGPGFIFPCTQESIEECLGRGLLGVPTGGALENVVKDIVAPGSTLFLANASNRTILGVFEAASPMTYNLEPNAWATSGFNSSAGGTSPYPLQVRVRCILEAPPVNETDTDVRSILGPYTDAGEIPGRAGPISDDQAQRLANLMASRAGVLMAGGLGSSLLHQQQQQGGQVGDQQQQQGGSSSSSGNVQNSHGSSHSMLPPSPIMPPGREPTQQRQPPPSGYAVRSPSMGPSSSTSSSIHYQNQQQTQHHPPLPPPLHHGPSSGSSSSNSNSNNNNSNNNMMLPPSNHHHHHSPTYHLSNYHKASLGASGGSTTSSTATSSSSHGSPLIDHIGTSSLSPTVLGLSPSTGSLNMRSSSSAGHQGGLGMMLPPPFVAAPPGVPLPASWRPL